MIYATHFFGQTPAGESVANQIVADSSGNAYVIGNTNIPDFPLKNPIQSLLTGSNDAFVLKLDPTGSMIYSTYFGADNTGNSITVDSGGNAYITGSINGSNSSIPVTAGVFQASPKSSFNAFAAKIDATGKQVYGTYLGGSVSDSGLGIAVDATGNAYIAGGTCSSDFPIRNAFQATIPATCGGSNNTGSGFLTKLTPDASALVYSTFFGGTDGAIIYAIALDSSGAPYVAGAARGIHFPLVNPIQSDFLDNQGAGPNGTTFSQAFVTAFNSAGSALQYSTFLGGFNQNSPSSIGLDSVNNVYFAGGILFNSFGTPVTFPIESFPILSAGNGVFQPFFPVCQMFVCVVQGFVAKITPTAGTALASPSTVDFGTVKKSAPSPAVAILIFNVGSTNIQINNTAITGDYSVSNNTCSGSLLSSKHCEVDVVFSPTAGGTRNGVLTLTSSAPDSPRNIQLTGIGGVPIVSLMPTGLNLTSPKVGAAGPAQTTVLTNTGADTLNITGLTIVGPNAADFSESHNCASTLDAGLSCNINVTYTASTSNTETATLQITDNAAGSPHSVQLTGMVSAFGLTLAPGTSAATSISAGQTATYQLMIGGQGFSGNVTLSCSGAPTAATCTVPGSETLSSTPTNFQAMVNTTARSGAVLPPSHHDWTPVSYLAVFLFGFSLLLIRNNRRAVRVLALGCISVGLFVLISCGGGGSTGGPTGTPAGTYTLTVTATSGGTTQSVNLTLNVN